MDDNHIITYLKGTLSEQEKKDIELQIETSAAFKKEMEDFRFIWLATENLKQQRRVDTASNWKQLSRRMLFLKIRTNVWNVSKIAAVLLLPLLLVTYYVVEKMPDNKPVEQVEITSAYGLISKVTLSDGSTVWLNSGSKLIYPRYFDGDNRQVFLNGEAYFEVKSDKRNRFDVLLPQGVQVSAYGTEFNVNAYEDEPKVEAVLSRGNIEVSVAGQTESKLLKVGQQAVIQKGKSDIIVSEANVYAQTAWKDGKMVFRRAKMDEIIKKLSRHFNVDIQLEGNVLYEYEYSATFTTESLSEILNLLKQSAPITWHSIDPDKQKDFTYPKRKVIIQMRK